MWKVCGRPYARVNTNGFRKRLEGNMRVVAALSPLCIERASGKRLVEGVFDGCVCRPCRQQNTTRMLPCTRHGNHVPLQQWNACPSMGMEGDMHCFKAESAESIGSTSIMRCHIAMSSPIRWFLSRIFVQVAYVRFTWRKIMTQVGSGRGKRCKTENFLVFCGGAALRYCLNIDLSQLVEI